MTEDITIQVNNEVIVPLDKLVLFLVNIVKKQGLSEFMNSVEDVDIIIITDPKGGAHMSTTPRCDCDNCKKLRAVLLQCLHSNAGSKETYERLQKAAENMEEIWGCIFKRLD